MATKKETTMQSEAKFNKTELLTAKKYEDKRDLLNAIIPDDFYGTIAEADSKIEKYLKGKVK